MSKPSKGGPERAHGGSYAVPPGITDIADDSRWHKDELSHKGPRCSVKGCPVVFASGEDRLCKAHREDDSTVKIQRYGYPYTDRGTGDG